MKKYIGDGIIYILGSGHSGSTLLNMLLNAHPSIIGLSEVDHFDRILQALSDGSLKGRYRKFWEGVLSSTGPLQIRTPGRRELRAWSDREKVQYQDCTMKLFNTVLRKDPDSRWVVDASKNWRRLSLLSWNGRFPVKVIHLTRNPLDVTASEKRKGRSVWRAILLWNGVHLKALRLKQEFPSDDWNSLTYRELTVTTGFVLRRLCEWLELPYTDRLLTFRDARDYGIGGNRMRLEENSRIKYREEWRESLTRWEVLLVRSLCGFTWRLASKSNRREKAGLYQ